MQKFRKKPVVIEAVRFTTNNDPYNKVMNDIVIWINKDKSEKIAYHDNTSIFIKTPEGTWIASVGDWIIKDGNEEFYLCRPEVFEKTYEAVSE